VEWLSALTWPAAICYAVWRLAQVAEQAVAQRVNGGAVADDDANVEIPEDLMALCFAEQEMWAQEQMMRVIEERYHDLRDWNLVRRAMGIGVMS